MDKTTWEKGAIDLLRRIIAIHTNPYNNDYDCQNIPCEWCVDVRKTIESFNNEQT